MVTLRCNQLRSSCAYWRRRRHHHRVHVSRIYPILSIDLFLSLSISIFLSLTTICIIYYLFGFGGCAGLARDGYIIYCYGDCNRKFEEALRAQQKTGDGDNLMKAIWLDMYTDQLSARRK